MPQQKCAPAEDNAAAVMLYFRNYGNAAGWLFDHRWRYEVVGRQILRIARFDIFRKSRVLRVSSVLPVNIAVAAIMLSGTLTR